MAFLNAVFFVHSDDLELFSHAWADGFLGSEDVRGNAASQAIDTFRICAYLNFVHTTSLHLLYYGLHLETQVSARHNEVKRIAASRGCHIPHANFIVVIYLHVIVATIAKVCE